MKWFELWSPENLLRTENGGVKVWFAVPKPHVSEILKMQNFARRCPLRSRTQKIRPCRELLAKRSHRLMVGKWLVETIRFLYRRIVQAIFFVTGRSREILVEHEIRDMVTHFGP